MDSLNSAPVSSLLDRLFAHSVETDARLKDDLARRPPEERAAIFAGARTDYRAFYALARDCYLPVSRQTGQLLYMLARGCGARAIVEFGTSFGISTLHLAAALKDNGGGILIGSEFEPGKAAQAREHLTAAGLSTGVDIREGDALETLARGLPAAVDLVLLDGAKVLYPKILALLEPHLRPGAFILADNAEDSPEYLAHVRNPAHGYRSLPLGGDVELTVRL